MKRLASPEFSVKVPAPILVSARREMSDVEVSLPPKTVEVSSRPTVRVLAEPPELFTVPRPASEPMIWSWLLRSNIAPDAIVSALRLGRTLPVLAVILPALICVEPPQELAMPRIRLPAPSLTTLPPVMSVPVLISVVPRPAKVMSDCAERRPPESVILPVALAEVMVNASLKYTLTVISSAVPVPDLLMATGDEPMPSRTIEPKPVLWA